ncbi:murein biosynthesis integral membrane protein MurJ [Homoserinimonas hongtaonis]|uniref:murein biosynthesis integral membrane protein MurJ n=1 Tax=Homoserinimonas hongtaonis TaxID=2079791 RepID=UPI000D378343|nr:murein biosynthesis integral membrane protein MurJ [Salinibacterium hongtaonis]AWB90433.1 murein biosynthesis integral membrane protein MurJ [Salinibacterium hongtaonis]
MTVSDDTPRGMGRSSALLASGTMVSRILGFVKAIVLAQAIGLSASAAADAFGAANQLPNNIYALIAGGVLGAILVPQIVRAGLHDDGGQRYINKLMTLGITVFALVTLLATLAAPLLVALYAQEASATGGRGFSSEGMALATAFAYWCLPQVFFYALYSLLGEVLNARRVFGPFAWAPAVNNIVAIAGLVAFVALFGGADANSDVSDWTPDKIAILAGTATLGIVAQSAVLMFFWRKVGLKFRPDFRWRGVGLAKTGKSAGWVFAMILVTQLAGLVQSRVASLPSGDAAGIATLQSSWLIFMLPHSVIAVSIATVFFTRMSSHATVGDTGAVRDDLMSSLRTIGLLIVLASFALIVLAIPFARVFEEDFGNVQSMAAVIAAYMVGLIPFSAVFVLQRTFYALEDTRTVFFIEVAKSALFVVGFLLCTRLPVEWIAVGIALVSSFTFLAQASLTFILLRRRLGPLGGRALTLRYGQYILVGLASSAVGFGLLLLFGAFNPAGFAVSGIVPALVTMVVIGGVMAVIYLGLLLALRNPELQVVRGILMRRLRPGHTE